MGVDIGFLRELVLAPGPSGFEEPVQELVRARLAPLAAPATDLLGNVTASVGPADALSVVVNAHADQIGLQVTWIDERGFVYFEKLGGVDPLLLPGRAVVVHTARGQVRGVVGKRPTHMIPEAERGKAADIQQQWIDIGAAGRDAAAARVGPGDPITFEPQLIELDDGLVAATALDDRAGLYVACRALELYAERPGRASLTVLSTVQEETRYMGAMSRSRGLDADCLVVVDGDFATDQPEVDPRRCGGELTMGKGPAIARGGCSNPRLFGLVVEVAAAEGIAVQVKAYPGDTQTDSEELQASGAAAVNLGLPIRYMHSPFEVVNADDLEAAAHLVSAVVRRLGEVFEPGFLTPRA